MRLLEEIDIDEEHSDVDEQKLSEIENEMEQDGDLFGLSGDSNG